MKKNVGNEVFMEAERQREYKNLQGDSGIGWHQPKISGDLPQRLFTSSFRMGYPKKLWK